MSKHITARQAAYMAHGVVQTATVGKATLTYKGGRWHMDGPSGHHSITDDGDIERLNAHWKVFSNHTANVTSK